VPPDSERVDPQRLPESLGQCRLFIFQRYPVESATRSIALKFAATAAVSTSPASPHDAGQQLRLWLASFGYVLLCALRRIVLAHTQFATATCDMIRLKLRTIGAQVRVSVRRVVVEMASVCPFQHRADAEMGGVCPVGGQSLVHRAVDGTPIKNRPHGQGQFTRLRRNFLAFHRVKLSRSLCRENTADQAPARRRP